MTVNQAIFGGLILGGVITLIIILFVEVVIPFTKRRKKK